MPKGLSPFLLMGGILLLGCAAGFVNYRFSAPHPAHKLNTGEFLPVRYHEQEDEHLILRVAAVNHEITSHTGIAIVLPVHVKSEGQAPPQLRVWIEIEPRSGELVFDPYEVTLHRGDTSIAPVDAWIPPAAASGYSRLHCLRAVTGIGKRESARKERSLFGPRIGRRLPEADRLVTVRHVTCFGLDFEGDTSAVEPFSLTVHGLSVDQTTLLAPVIHFSKSRGRIPTAQWAE
jgi:hypothetical protein